MRSKSRSKTKPNAKTPGFIRIIAGSWRGRKLPVHDIQGLRPTTDRVKETLFNWLMSDVRSSCCLDGFAGSGALGFEALSRGADSVTLIEKDTTAANQLKQNLALLSVNNATLVKSDCLDYLANNDKSQTFSLVFIDPPFRLGLAEKACGLLQSNGWLAPSALIYVEVESELEQLNVPSEWQLLKHKNAGQVSYRLYRRMETDT